MKILSVPMGLQALLADQEIDVAKTGYNFATLPYQNEDGADINSGTAFLASSSVQVPFANLDKLSPGVHLHWTIPTSMAAAEVKIQVDEQKFLDLGGQQEDWDELVEYKVITPGIEDESNFYYYPPQEQVAKWVELDKLLQQSVVSGGEELSMPQAPNRWLIIRRSKEQRLTKKWLVESDYLYAAESSVSNAIVVPYAPDTSGGIPFRYLGKKTELVQQWQEDETVERLTPLTALGWGNPEFNAFYNECSSVFGFHDSEITSAAQAQGNSYEVYGWYSNQENDYVQTVLHTTLNRREFAASKLEEIYNEQQDAANADGDYQEDADVAKEAYDAAVNAANFEKVVQDTAEWTLTAEEEADASLCYAKLEFGSDVNLDDGIASASSHLALAPSGSEAISTYLSQQLTQDLGINEDLTDEEQAAVTSSRLAQQTIIENQLEAIDLSEAVEGKNIDFINQLKAARHKKGFAQINGGTLWSFNSEDGFTLSDSSASATEIATFIDEIKQFKQEKIGALQEVNELQQQLDQLDFALESQRELIYADWTKYMLCLYPTDRLNDAAYPASDKIKHFIENKSMAAFEALQDNRNQLQEVICGRLLNMLSALQTLLQRLSGELDLDNIASQAALQLKELANINTLDDEQVKILIKLPLRAVPGPRFWQANEPALLISGEVASPLQSTADEINCQLLDITYNSFVDWVANLPQVASTDAIISTLEWQDVAINSWQQQPWIPALMEWEVGLYPDSNIPTDTTSDYPANFITNNYRLPLNDDEFALPAASVDLQHNSQLELSDSPTIVKGRSSLTPGVKRVVTDKLDTYLKLKFAEKGVDDFAAYIEQNPEADYNDPIYTAAKAHEQLVITDGLTQRLIGLFDEYLMQQSGLSLSPLDPLQLVNSDQSFSNNIKSYLGEDGFKLPSPYQRLTPIRSGISQFNQLRIVDSFGRYKDIDATTLLRPQRQTKWPDQEPGIYLPPRLVQPARLNFRWKMVDELNSGATPVCGWILYNYFDETLVIYNTQGNYLGVINSDGELLDSENVKIDITQDGNIFSEANLHLAVMVKKLQSFHNSNTVRTSDGKNYLPKLKEALRRAQQIINPVDGDLERAFMAARPMAIVKASLNFEIKGLPAVDKSWSALDVDMHAEQYRRSCRQYNHVQFPIKIGEYNNLEDGLIAYWEQSTDGSLPGRGYFPQSAMDDVIDENDSTAPQIDAASFNYQMLVVKDSFLRYQLVVNKIKFTGQDTVSASDWNQLIADGIISVLEQDETRAYYFPSKIPGTEDITSVNWQTLVPALEASVESNVGVADENDWQNLLDDGILQAKADNSGNAYYIPGTEPQDSDPSEAKWTTLQQVIDASVEGDYIDVITEDGVENLSHSIDADPIELLMLIEADASIHASCGIVPRKTLRLESSMYSAALEQIEKFYFAAPLLTPKDKYALPLPLGIWQWQQRESQDNNSLIKRASVVVINKNTLLENGATEEDWNTLIDTKVLRQADGTPDTHLAYYFPVDEEVLKNADGDILFEEDYWSALKDQITASSEPAITQIEQIPVITTNQIEAVEGTFRKINLPD